MKTKTIKRVISGAVSALMLAASIPASVTAADQQTRGNIGGFDYEMWNQNGQGQASMNPGAGSFTCSWSNIENFLARMGKNYDSQKKNYKAFGDIYLTYDVEYSPKGNSYMCVYGWTRNPLMEYYIVEGWGDWRPPGNDGENKGTVTLNGNTYDIRKTMRYNQPSLDGTATFPQYWSVRQKSGSQNNTTNYMKGTIDVSKHFDAWSKAGLDMSGTLYEVSLNIEGYRSNGSANVKSVSVTSTPPTDTGSSSTTDNQGGGQTIGDNGGNNGGGFDWGNMGGNNGGGFDWGNMGGNNGGNNGGNIDWGGMAGGFNGGGGDIGSDPGNGGNASSGLNAKIKNDMPTTVPSGAEQKSGCKVEKKTYNCKFTGGQKSCNVVLPPNYDPNKKYPVMYILHGIGGDENSMVNGMGVQELLSGLIASGKAEEMIVVLPSQFTSKNGAQGGFGINQETCAAYDNFLYDISDSLIPFIEANYPVKTGRENRAITGFSMGGREAIYIGLMRPDLFAYVGGACPAPSITPGKDMFMEHPGCMTESEMKFRDVGPEPNVFMITGGTNDSVVGTFPKQYSDILTRNGVEHVYQSIPGGGHGDNSVKPHLYTFYRYAFKAGESAQQITTTTTTTKVTTTTTSTTTTTAPVTTDVPGNIGGGKTKADIDAAVTLWGDANCDGTVDMSDVVAVMQNLANPDKYKLTDKGAANADVSAAGAGLTSNDALTIQKFLLGSIKNLPASYMNGIS